MWDQDYTPGNQPSSLEHFDLVDKLIKKDKYDKVAVKPLFFSGPSYYHFRVF